jgi:hypothetical protein
MPCLFFSVVVFMQRKKPFPLVFITQWFDRRFGPGAFGQFLQRLKPVALFASGCFVLGGTGLVSTLLTTQDRTAYVISGFFLSGGVGLLIAFLLSVRFPPRLA